MTFHGGGHFSGGEGGHREGEMIEDDGAEEVANEEHKVFNGLGPDVIVAIEEEFAVGGGD
ncbi:MBL fold metallo-hydrolase [Sesbania bispinosa]|nr:MBL fold metallo-hydrolase [Sesbania bispinosa]